MKYEQWAKNPSRFLAMTGLDHEVFEQFLPYFEECHRYYFNRFDLDGKPVNRQRLYTIYKNSPLPTFEERLVFVLSYMKLNPIQEQHADMFSMTQQQCNRFLHALLRVFELGLGDCGSMPERTKEGLLRRLEELPEEFLTEKKVIHDGTEREIPRPADYQQQQDYYSGKKKKHTVKNAVITNMLCLILFVGATVQGTVHDKK